MWIKHIKGDALEWALEPEHAMIHVCNNKGGYGGGKTALATQIRKISPSTYKAYLKHYKDEGTASCGDDKSFINLIAQDGYGSRGKGVKYLREDWLRYALEEVVEGYFTLGVEGDPTTIVVPYLMGCDRAGGDWETVFGIVTDTLSEYFNILVVEYEGKT